MLTDSGVYIHIPFCEQKCSYCDFYSFKTDPALKERYACALCDRIKVFGERFPMSANTVYVGGGTPTVLDGEMLSEIIATAKKAFGFSSGEITVEANPADDLADTFARLSEVGVNRISLGVQSANANELEMLGRRHMNRDVERTVAAARNSGINNISLDLMLGVPYSNEKSLRYSLDFLTSFDPQHISAYILKIEQGTPFGRADISSLCLPGDDETAEMYLKTCEYLAGCGYEHYEISNFAKKGCRSSHNTKYWLGKPYLGLGPAAHSFINGCRYRFGRSIEDFINGGDFIYDGSGGDAEEYIMLRLRLSDGLIFDDFRKKFGCEFRYNIKKAAALKSAGLIEINDNSLRLTEKGFLLSNSIITEFI